MREESRNSFSSDADQRFDTKSNARLGGHQFGSNSLLPLHGAKLQSNARGDGRFWKWLTLTSRLFPWYSTRDFEQILTCWYLGLEGQHFVKEIGFLTFNWLMVVWTTRSTFAGIGVTIWSSLHIQQTLVQQISQTIRLEISLCCDIHNVLVLGGYRFPLWRWPEDRVSSTSSTILQRCRDQVMTIAVILTPPCEGHCWPFLKELHNFKRI